MQLRDRQARMCKKNHTSLASSMIKALCTMASLHKAARGYNLKHWIAIVDSLIYKNCWQSGHLLLLACW